MNHRSRAAAWVLAGVVALAMAMGLGACSNDDPQLPTVGGPTAGSGAGGDLVSVAQAFHDCLTDAGLPAAYDKDFNGQPTVVTFDVSVKALGIDPDGMPFNNKGVTDAEASDFFQKRDFTTPVLEIDGVDHTDVWKKCYASSGYNVNKILQDMMKAPVVSNLIQIYVDASNAWARCSRENGFPETKDAVMPTRPIMNAAPAALLPPSITEPQLRDLLTKCPNFDVERMKKTDEIMGQIDQSDPSKITIPEGLYIPPSISFDYPGFRASDTDEPTNDATSEKLVGLMTILQQPMNDYYAGVAASATEAGPTP